MHHCSFYPVPALWRASCAQTTKPDGGGDTSLWRPKLGLGWEALVWVVASARTRLCKTEKDKK